MFKISIIIPTINEANNLPLLLSDLLTTYQEGEIIIVDCGSDDRTIDVAKIYGAKVYRSKEKNRGLQLDIGAKNSKGDWLIFLHADTRLNYNWYVNINLPIINRKWGTENVLQNTIDNFASTKLKYKFLEKKIDIDTIIDIENRK